MSGSERRFLSEDENFFRVEYLEESGPIEDDEDVVLYHEGDTGAVVEVSGQIATKTHRASGPFTRERDAMLFLSGQRLAGVPRLLAVNETAQRLTLERIFGKGVEAIRADNDERVWSMAGAWLRTLHQLPVETTDRLSFSEAMRARLRTVRPTVEAQLSDTLRATLETIEEALRSGRIPDGPRVFAHRDFRPRNWMLRRDASFVAVDFEHSRPDFVEWDLVRLLPYWRSTPPLQRVFLRAYRDARMQLSDERLRVAAFVDALQTLAWGLEHGRDDYQASGLALAAKAAEDYAERATYFQFP